MSKNSGARGTWFHRFIIRFFTVVLGILFFWLLGFLVEDIERIPGPQYSAVEKQYVDGNLLQRRDSLQEQVAVLDQQISNLQEKQRVLGDSSQNLQRTINQLVELKKISLQNNLPQSETEQENFTRSLNLFLENQTGYQQLSTTMAETVDRKQALARELGQAEQRIQDQQQPAVREYERLTRRHSLKLAAYQLAILLPILAIAAILILRKHSSIYFPLFLAFGAAALVKVALVLHEYFPSQYFKYVLILALLLAVTRLLVHFIRSLAHPQRQWLVKQYREAYERFLCPVCEYPIRTGPRRFLFWTRRTVNKLVVPAEQSQFEETYTCPSCGSQLFEECPTCHKIRHALLPHCAHCGEEKLPPSA